MKKILIIIMLLITINIVNAEFKCQTNTYLTQYNATSKYQRTVQNLMVESDYDEYFKVANEGNIEALIVYNIEDLSQAGWNHIDFVNVTCTYSDSHFDSDGNYEYSNSTVIHSEVWNSGNTPSGFQVISADYSLADQTQCLYDVVYNINSSITVEYPHTRECITPSYRTNFVELKISELQLREARNSFDTLTTFNNNITRYISMIIEGVFELWLVIFWLIKIALIYLAFILIMVALAFPVILLVKFREKIISWLKRKNEIN